MIWDSYEGKYDIVLPAKLTWSNHWQISKPWIHGRELICRQGKSLNIVDYGIEDQNEKFSLVLMLRRF